MVTGTYVFEKSKQLRLRQHHHVTDDRLTRKSLFSLLAVVHTLCLFCSWCWIIAPCPVGGHDVVSQQPSAWRTDGTKDIRLSFFFFDDERTAYDNVCCGETRTHSR